jgi:Fe-S-cluster containining protein
VDQQLAERLSALYERVGAVVQAASPRCEMSGRCCDFPVSEHRLYASDLETEYAVAAAGGKVPPTTSGQCPWYVDGLCQNRKGRPLGCRVYFCDPAWEEGMPLVYERFHAELRVLHDEHALTYSYRLFVDAVVETPRGTPFGTPSGTEASC